MDVTVYDFYGKKMGFIGPPQMKDGRFRYFSAASYHDKMRISKPVSYSHDFIRHFQRYFSIALANPKQCAFYCLLCEQRFNVSIIIFNHSAVDGVTIGYLG